MSSSVVYPLQTNICGTERCLVLLFTAVVQVIQYFVTPCSAKPVPFLFGSFSSKNVLSNISDSPDFFRAFFFLPDSPDFFSKYVNATVRFSGAVKFQKLRHRTPPYLDTTFTNLEKMGENTSDKSAPIRTLR